MASASASLKPWHAPSSPHHSHYFCCSMTCNGATRKRLRGCIFYCAAARLLVVGCARGEELPPQHPLRTFPLHLRNTMRVTEILLDPLDAAETTQLASQVAKRALAMDEGLHLYRETGGYPLFVVEMAR